RPRRPLQNPRRPHPPGDLRTAVPAGRTDRGCPDRAGRDLAAGCLKTSRRPQTGRARARPPRRPADALQRATRRPRPADRLDQRDGRLLAEEIRRSRRFAETDGPMTNTATETRTVVVEREMPHPPEKLWRARTQPHLMEEWLMKNDFKPVVGHQFNLRGEWGGVLDCEVLAIEPNKALSYTWNFKHDDAAFNLQSVVTFTLTPTRAGTLLRMEQSGFRPDQKQAFGGAHAGWQQFFAKLEDVLARAD